MLLQDASPEALRTRLTYRWMRIICCKYVNGIAWVFCRMVQNWWPLYGL
jgi:hypothetical protein